MSSIEQIEELRQSPQISPQESSLLALAVKARRVKARRHPIDFAPLVYPGWERSKHHEYLSKVLEKATNRESGWTRLCISTPPQHGKSLFVTTIYPAWYRGIFPDDPIIVTAYGDDHALTFSRRVRNIIDSEEYKMIFPHIEICSDSRSVEHWEIKSPYKGEFHAAGIFGGVTGKGAKLLIIDDPIKNREDAESKSYRNKCIDGYKSTLSTRLHKDAIEICMMTRWHENDPAGWLLKYSGKGFRYINLPALAEEDDPLGREVGEALWENRFPKAMLEEQKKSIGSYDWESLYQGHPRPPEGLMFKRKLFQIVPEAPRGLFWNRYWDLATSEKSSGHYTASCAIAHDRDGNVYIRDMIRGKWQWGDVRNKIKQTCLSEMKDYNIWFGIEAQGVQKGMVQEIWRDEELINIGIIGIPVSTDKRIRAIPCITANEQGRIYLVRGDWNDDLIEECAEFPSGEYDDQVDSMSGGFSMMAMNTGRM
jgi:predicted phage terminase large subunit-like protein